uniref:ATPase AAA type domain containing protein n=1 Tax=Babesia bovis TaxID=5865 RepID=A7ASH9_BABBO|eukprot:XP_001611066.1 ATPase AAA type domain containing protein [Babesia bovis T2Bo]
MSKKIFSLRLKSLIEAQQLQWPPLCFSQTDVTFALDGDRDNTVEIDTLISQLQDVYSDYRRQKCGVLRSDDAVTSNADVAVLNGDYLPSIDSQGPGLQSLNVTMSDLRRCPNASERDKGDAHRKIRKRSKKEDSDPEETATLFIPERDIPYRLDDVGGIEAIRGDIIDLVVRPLKFPDIYKYLCVQPTKGILLHGPPGSGKSRLAEAIAGEANCAFFRVAATELVTGMSGESESRLRGLFDEAKRCAPSIIFLDEIDAVTPHRENSSRGFEKRIVAQLGICMDSLADHFVIVIGATNRPECLDSMIRRNGRFDREISMGIPNTDARFSILKAVSRGMRLGTDVDFEQIAEMTPGFVGADLQAVTREAAACAISRLFANHGDMITNQSFVHAEACISQSDFISGVSRVQPSAKREGFATIPNVTWDNVGALSNLRKEMEEHIVFPILFKRLYSTFGLTVPAGILLYGPPGCGKTLLAKAVANGSKANFISVKGPELLNKYVGESERAVRLVFQRAAVSAPCVVFFDEIDSLCPVRNNEANHTTERVVNQLLTEMDGIHNRADVYVLAATNRPDIIDPAMLRPGRLERQMYVPLPDMEGRVDILQKVTKGIPIGDDVDFQKIAVQTEGYSGADLACLVREAGISAVEKLRIQYIKEHGLDTYVRSVDAPPGACISAEDLASALLKVSPSVTQKQINFYESFQQRKTMKN